VNGQGAGIGPRPGRSGIILLDLAPRQMAGHADHTNGSERASIAGLGRHHRCRPPDRERNAWRRRLTSSCCRWRLEADHVGQVHEAGGRFPRQLQPVRPGICRASTARLAPRWRIAGRWAFEASFGGRLVVIRNHTSAHPPRGPGLAGIRPTASLVQFLAASARRSHGPDSRRRA